MIRVRSVPGDDPTLDLDTRAERLVAGFVDTVDSADDEIRRRRPAWTHNDRHSWWRDLLDQAAFFGLHALVSGVDRAWSHNGQWAEREPHSLDLAEIHALIAAEPRLQVAVLYRTIADYAERSGRQAPNEQFPEREWRRMMSLAMLATSLLSRRLPHTDGDLVRMLDLVADRPEMWRHSYLVSPHTLVGAVKDYAAESGLSPELGDALTRLKTAVLRDDLPLYGSEQRRLLTLINDALNGGRPPLVELDDAWGQIVRRDLDGMAAPEREAWSGLLAYAKKAKGSRPTPTYLKRAERPLAALTREQFAGQLARWLEPLVAWSPGPVDPHGLRGTQDPAATLGDRNSTMLKGLVWCAARAEDVALAARLAETVEVSYKKVTGLPPRFVKVANAAIWALGEMPGMDGAMHLQRLAGRVKQATGRSEIEASLGRAAERLGLDRTALDDLAVPTFDLVDGRHRRSIGPYTAEIAVEGVGRVELRWYGADGSPRRSEPSEVRRAHAEERAALRRTVKEIERTLTAQRTRVEQCILTQRQWSVREWRAHYLDHPLLAAIARRLIWAFEGEGRRGLGAWLDGRLVDEADAPLAWLTDETRVRLWHPITTATEQALAWRRWVEGHEVRQPFKQAHREIYVLTDAERTTETYSNRFAAHIIRQHQFKALCDAQYWRYSLGTGRDGQDCAIGGLPGGLHVEFWVEPTYHNLEELSPAGIALYAATDQVHFHRAGAAHPMRLAEVPPLVFSEVMRDVDLFVGVCSVGNDPTWQDRGLEPHRQYWQDYAFGDLSATAQTRRAVLERLLPRLAIADRCTLRDRFLVVRGDLRGYKIHLGSGNILMEPNDQYLCIVPGRSGAGDTAGLALPFEGDGMLSIILSKALLLAADTKITDPTITRQIAAR